MTTKNPRRDAVLKLSSDRAFGLIVSAFLVIVSLWPSLHGDPARRLSLAIGAVFLLLALLSPKLLHPLNRLWMRFGLLLHHIVSPIALGLVFFLTVVPIGLWMRLVGKDPLKLSFDKSARTYWISRTPPGPDPHSMDKQF